MKAFARRVRSHLTYANVMSTIAVFIALGGVSYAAVKLPKNSVGPAQIKKNAVTITKIAPTARKQLFAAGAQGLQGPQGLPGLAGAKGDPRLPAFLQRFGGGSVGAAGSSAVVDLT